MESVWGMYSSCEPPVRAAPQDPELRVDEDGEWPVLQAMEAAMFNAGIETLGGDYDSGDDDEPDGGVAAD